MSGPKVVRIVTREEVIAICRRTLARLDASVIAWTRACVREDLADPAEIAKVERRRDAIRALLAEDDFSTLQKQAPEEIEFLHADLAQRRTAAAEAAAAERTRRRRLAGASSTLLGALEKAGIEVPEALSCALDEIGSGVKIDGAEAAISQGFALLAPAPEGAIGERQREIARQLGEGEATETLAGWLVGRPPIDDERGREIDRRLAALELTEGAEAAQPFADRAASVAAEPSPSRRLLLADSLIFDLANEAKRQEERQALAAELEQLAGELRICGTTAAAQVVAAREASAAGDVAAMRLVAVELKSALEEVQAQLAADARRRAVLSALAQLGYEAREDMETAWVEDGSVVLRNPATVDLGVKLSGGKAGGPVQLRPVRFGAARSAEADRDAEIMWCGDFDTLKDTLSGMRAELTLVQAAPVGTFRLELVKAEASDRDRAAVRRPKISRTLG